MRHFRVCPWPEEAERDPFLGRRSRSGWKGYGKDEKNGPTEVIRRILAGGWEGKMEILELSIHLPALIPLRSLGGSNRQALINSGST